MLVDANILLFAVDEASAFHERARDWLTEALNGPRRVGLPWLSLGAFLRIATHPRASESPLPPEDAWRIVRAWLDNDLVWVPTPADRHAEILGALITKHRLTGNLVTDGQVTALAIEHGIPVVSADGDFARFDEITWVNPLA